MWRKFKGETPQGILTSGDPAVPPTTRWNHLCLLFFVWKRATIFRVSRMPDDGFHVGYIPQGGVPMYNTTIMTELNFRVKNGHEDCIFFAIDRRGNELELKFVRQVNISDQSYDFVPLI